jgi:putative ABC transport system permease protein
VTEKVYPSLKLNDVAKFIDSYKVNSVVSLHAYLTWIAEVKHASAKTNPNVGIVGANEEYMAINALELK